MNKKAESSGNMAGGIINLCILGPMWLIMLYLIIDALGDKATGMLWGLYFAYVPVHVIGAGIAVLVYTQELRLNKTKDAAAEKEAEQLKQEAFRSVREFTERLEKDWHERMDRRSRMGL